MRKNRLQEQSAPYPMIKELPAEERPRERLMQYGAGSLNAMELIALLLRSGTQQRSALDLAGEILKRFGSLRALASASAAQIAEVPGVGTAKAAEIVAALELGRRVAQMGQGERAEISNPQDVFNLLSGLLREERREHFYALLLNTKNFVIKLSPISIGTLDMSLVSPRELFREAIREGAANVIVAHNHPSGDPTPSTEDVLVTHRLKEAGELIGISLLDHIVIGDGQFVSLRERGYIR